MEKEKEKKMVFTMEEKREDVRVVVWMGV